MHSDYFKPRGLDHCELQTSPKISPERRDSAAAALSLSSTASSSDNPSVAALICLLQHPDDITHTEVILANLEPFYQSSLPKIYPPSFSQMEKRSVCRFFCRVNL